MLTKTTVIERGRHISSSMGQHVRLSEEIIENEIVLYAVPSDLFTLLSLNKRLNSHRDVVSFWIRYLGQFADDRIRHYVLIAARQNNWIFLNGLWLAGRFVSLDRRTIDIVLCLFTEHNNRKGIEITSRFAGIEQTIVRDAVCLRDDQPSPTWTALVEQGQRQGYSIVAPMPSYDELETMYSQIMLLQRLLIDERQTGYELELLALAINVFLFQHRIFGQLIYLVRRLANELTLHTLFIISMLDKNHRLIFIRALIENEQEDLLAILAATSSDYARLIVSYGSFDLIERIGLDSYIKTCDCFYDPILWRSLWRHLKHMPRETRDRGRCKLLTQTSHIVLSPEETLAYILQLRPHEDVLYYDIVATAINDGHTTWVRELSRLYRLA